ncbi:hypothetical protein C4E44_02800 [Pseudomonas sp. MWU12-2312b]|nr:hypothetical protein C4E44_02800 [Pseudomonas sp. MWU12-2312b]
MTVFKPLSGTSSTLADSSHEPYRDLYVVLYSHGPDAGLRAQTFLRQQLARAAELPCDLPEAPEQLSAWAEQHCAEVARAYARYMNDSQHRVYRDGGGALGEAPVINGPNALRPWR